MVKRTLRVPEDSHGKLRWMAYKARRSQHALILGMLAKALAGVELPDEGKEGRG